MNFEGNFSIIEPQRETGKENNDEQKLRAFSKKHASFFRKEIAQRINNLRFIYQNKLIEKPEEIAEHKKEIEQKKEKIDLIEVEKAKEKENILINENEIKDAEKELELAKQIFNNIKNSFLFKIKKLLSKRNAEFDISILESEIDYKSKTLDFHKDNKNLSEKSFKEKEKIIFELKNEIEEKYKLISEADSILKNSDEFIEIDHVLDDFYGKIREEKINFESEFEKRDVRKISEDKDVLFCHAIPLQIIADTAFSQNNQLVKTNKFGPVEKIKILQSIEPTISVSTINEKNQTLAHDFGVILKGGKVLSSYAGDVGTYLDGNIYNRKSKYDHDLESSNIQSDFEGNLNRSIDHLQKRDSSGYITSVEDMSQGWNELIVEDPQVAGLFFKKDHHFVVPGDLQRAKSISENLNIPLYVLNENKVYKIDNQTGNLTEIEKEKIFNNVEELEKEKKKYLIGEIIDKEAFNIKRENIFNFNAYNAGKAYYKFIKRIDAGEKVSIERFHDGDILGEDDEIIPQVGYSCVISVNKLNEKQWEFYGKEHWEKYEKYYHEDGSFNDRFMGSSVWEPHSSFERQGDDISSYIDMAEREFERLDKQSYECKKKGKNLGEIPIRKKSVNFILYGFGEECKKAGDLENFERIKKIIEKFGNLNECENFVMKRSGKDGEFQTLEEDIPIEIRKKIKELNG